MNIGNIPQKKQLQQRLLKELQIKLNELEVEMEGLREAKTADTKSSAGDKYETGRESLSQTQGLLEAQQSKLLAMFRGVERVHIAERSAISEGALLHLSIGWVWVAVPFGKISLDKTAIQVVSPQAPLVQSLKSIKVGESISLNGRKVELKGIF